jgi:hypothetical protein
MKSVNLPAALTELRAAYDADHAECQRVARLPSKAPPTTCRYCGKHWRYWQGSKLDGHAQCTVSGEFKRYMSVLLGSPQVTYQIVAGALGVSVSTVHAWFVAARLRRTV